MIKPVSLFTFLFALIAVQSFSAGENVSRPRVSKAIYFDVSPSLRDLAKMAGQNIDRTWKDGVVKNVFFDNLPGSQKMLTQNVYDPGLQSRNGTTITDTTIVNFEGMGATAYVPPDTHGEAGSDYYFQVVNCSYAIYNKTGSMIFGPYGSSTIWSGMPNNTNSGDAVVVWDEVAQRWLFTQFSLPFYPNAPFFQMIAVSQTPDPTGSWYRWEFEFPDMPDYPKFGVWPDGYYMSSNRFASGGGGYMGPGLAAFDRTAMLAGDPDAQSVTVEFSPGGEGFITMLPSDCDGTFPPMGTPDYFMYIRTGSSPHLGIYEFHADWTNPGNSTFGNNVVLPVNAFNTFNNGGITQKGTSTQLDPISDRLMYNMKYRVFNGYSSMVANHTVNTGSNIAGVRWYELRNTGSSWSVYQQATYALSDNRSRWMGSIAIDTAGTIALGYSIAGADMYPSIRYTGRFKTDALNTMTIAERTIINGSGGQTGSWGGRSRWGDYSGMSVDPENPTTFWYTTEYYSTTSSSNWQTRVGSFTFGNVFSIAASATPAMICGGVPSQLDVNAYGGSSNYTYSWTSIPAGFTSNIKDPVVTPTITTKYIAAVNDGSQTKHDTTQVSTVQPASVNAGNDTTVCRDVVSIALHGTASNYTFFSWATSGDGTFTNSGLLNTSYHPGTGDRASDSVDLALIAFSMFPCTGNVRSIKNVTFDPCNGVADESKDLFSVKISPNPTNGIMNIKLNGLRNKVTTIKLSDLNGKTICSCEISGQSCASKTIDLTDYPAGVYIVKVQSENNLWTGKVVVE
ncbi:MAG: T9SS type A sorting domain-containing protein [Bacteroidetes bacterium]|nr:T9SS type A sorting domain-containing protein [Bacteroidota bacterium]